MSRVRSLLLYGIPLACVLSLGWACQFDGSLREYLWGRFWSPFAKGMDDLKGGIERSKFAYAGMDSSGTAKPLEDLRSAYRKISDPSQGLNDEKKLSRLVAAARSAKSLSSKEREEVELIDAKIDLRLGSPEAPEPLRRSRKKLEQFLHRAQTPEFLSEARGWVARVHYLLGNQTAAGKIYLDELNRSDSNLPRETLITSLRMTYGYDGGPELVNHLDEYFDTAEHAAFAIRLVTNPDRQEDYPRVGDPEPKPARPVLLYSRIKGLLQQHRSLFATNEGARDLGLLGMRAALSAGDPSGSLQLASHIPIKASVRGSPDFQWMLASAYFLSKNYAGAGRTLRQLFTSRKTVDDYKAAAAYGLCGIYFKLGNRAEQIRYALWLDQNQQSRASTSYPSVITDGSIYWAVSGFDLRLLLDAEAPIPAIQEYLSRYPKASGNELVTYSLAVRLSRENRYREAAAIYNSLHVSWRSARMYKLDALYSVANTPEAKYRMAAYLAENPDRIYFNDRLWNHLQRYALYGQTDGRFARPERRLQVALERKLKDDQEELWRAYLISREAVREAGRSEVGRRAARLGVQCLRRISGRFGREDEIQRDDIQLSSWLLSGAGRLP